MPPFIAPAQRAETSRDRHYSAFGVLEFRRWSVKMIAEIPDCAEATGVLVRAIFGRVLTLPEHGPALL